METAPTTSAMAGSAIENEKRSRMMASLYFVYSFRAAICNRRQPDFKVDPSLLERTLFHADETSDQHGSRHHQRRCSDRAQKSRAHESAHVIPPCRCQLEAQPLSVDTLRGPQF